MMNQGANSEVVAPPGTISVENRHFFGASHGQPSTYLPSSTESEASPWVTQRINNFTTENGGSSTVSDQQILPPGSDGLNPPTVANSTSVGPSSATQEYNGYVTSSYGYGAPDYTSYYSGYQQNNNPSYSQPTGAYQNTGVPYQPISSFQNTGSYAVPTSYSSTHYNPGDYQTAGGYPSSSYSNQTASWSVGNYANYSNYQYPNYPPTSTGSYAPVSASAAPSVNYQQQYQQWANYYAQTEVSCAPGTENLSVAGTTNLQSSVPGVTSSYLNSNSQQLPTSTPSWRPESSSSEYPSSQPGTAVSATQDNYWKNGASSFQNHHINAAQSEYYQPLDPKSTYSSYQDPQKTAYPQAPSLQYTNVLQVPQNHQSPQQVSPSLAAQKVSKVQIPTNPRIISNLAVGLGKSEKVGGAPAAAKPAYISISLPKPSEGLPSNDASDSAMKPGSFPKSLRGYVERALARCIDDNQKAACQAIMKELITKATADGTLHTKDWDTEPLFPLPDTNKDSQPAAQASVFKRSPSRRTKSRWEPLPDEKLADKSALNASDGLKYSGWDNVNLRDRKPLGGDFGGKGDRANNTKHHTPNQKNASVQRPFKRQRLSDHFLSADKDDMSSDSDKEQNLVDYYSGATALANTPEERKRREDRSKRFEKVKGNRADVGNFKSRTGGSVNLYSRRATALVVSKNFDDGGSRAVEDIDWDALTVKGTCQEIEKRYLRLTSAPDPATVRPEDVLEKALAMVENLPKNYLFKCDQLKSIRQDLTVQRIRNQLTVKVYETHARLALENGDLAEYNQCQSQLKILYAEGIDGCHMEFAAYNLLCVILHSNNNRDLLSSMARLSKDAKEDEAVKHALAVRAAVTSGNYVTFFKLYKTAPNLHPFLMDLYVEKMRYKAVNCMARSYRPMVPVSYIAQVLGFASASSLTEGVEEKEMDGIEECVEWLKAHGACLVPDNNGEMQLDAKASSSTLYMPEPEDAVAHGDASLAVNDFLTRALS